MENFSSDTHPGDFEPGSIESRAAARARLGAHLPPHIILRIVHARDGMPHPGQRIVSAFCNGRNYTRDADETERALVDRILLDWPVTPQIVVLKPEGN